MNGKWPVVILIGAAAAVGGGVWYAQEYAYYSEIDPQTADTRMRVTLQDGGSQIDLPIRDFRGIDASSSPIRWRACFTVEDMPAPGQMAPYPDAAPAYGPGWFDCFDAGQIGADLESGAAMAYLGSWEIRPDVDRVIAIYPDGRAYGWHQLNDKTPERGVMD